MMNPAQELAVKTVKGRLLVLAGAGSGKTRVIVHRIAYLIDKVGILPQEITGLTFTNKAAAEMRERVQALIGAEKAKSVTLCTFHSFCMQALRKDIGHLGYTRGFSLYDERDMDRVIGQLIKEMLGQERDLPSLAPTRAALAHAFNQGTPPEGSSWHDQFSKDLYHRLQSTLRAYNALDFDHLIHLCVTLFEKHPSVLDRYQEKCKYLMIDEYQDTNPAQFRLAELLAAKHRNLCVVGDDDQSIYGWRGAKVDHILHFKADQTMKLEQNYRSTQIILDAANGLIGRNVGRHNKNLWSEDRKGDLIEVFNAPTEMDEALGVVQRILKYKEEKHLPWSEMAVLYRSNALSRSLELALMQASWQDRGHWVRGIPYEIFGGLEFSERSEIKDLFSYLRTIANPSDEEALLRILNVPRRGISDAFLDEMTQHNRSEKIPLWQLLEEVAAGKRQFSKHPKGTAGVISFVDLMAKAKKRFSSSEPLADSLQWLLEEIQYKRAIEEEVKSEKMRQFKWENVQESISALAQYEQEAEEGASLQDFVSQTALGRPPSTRKSKEDKVQVMTLHSAKGLEFSACFIIGLEDHILPHEKSLMETGIEEERRLFYVGITRARKFLTLSMARSRMRMGKIEPTNPSRFLFELPKHLLKATSYK